MTLLSPTARRHAGRHLAAHLGLVVVLTALVVVAVSLGEYPLALSDVVRSLAGLPSPADLVVHQLRLPRILTGVLAGAGFGLAGAIFQACVRNPLASPDLIGVTAGASVGAVATLTLAGVSVLLAPLFALAGGALAALAVYLLAYRRGLALHRLVVVGIALGGTGFAAGALSSGTSFLLIKAEVTNAQQATVWLTGSLHGRTYDHALAPLAALLMAIPLLPLTAHLLRTLSLGDDVAAGLGIRLHRARAGLLALGVLLAAAATAAVGPIGFVALGAPQIARRLLRTSVEPLLASLLVGAVVVTVADLLGRFLFAPTELPAGVFTAAVGGPYLLWLLTRTQEKR